MRLTTSLRHVPLLTIALTFTLLHGSAYGGGRHPVASSPRTFDGDPGCAGCPDIAVADKGLRAISVRFGNGDATSAWSSF